MSPMTAATESVDGLNSDGSYWCKCRICLKNFGYMKKVSASMFYRHNPGWKEKQRALAAAAAVAEDVANLDPRPQKR